jgi:hypothetical protein
MWKETDFARKDGPEQALGKGNCNLRRRSIPCYIACGCVMFLLLKVSSGGEDDMLLRAVHAMAGSRPTQATGRSSSAST